MISRLMDLYRRFVWSPVKYARFLGVKLGNNCSVATRYFGSEPYLIEIGDHVQITQDVRFFNHGGGWVFRHKHPDFDTFGKIKIGNNVYIGACAMIMPGVTIGNNVIIGAATVVTKSIPDNAVVAGNPGRVLGNVDELETRLLPYNLRSKGMSPAEKRAFLLSVEDDRLIKK